MKSQNSFLTTQKLYNSSYTEIEKRITKSSEITDTSENFYDVVGSKENKSQNNCDVNEMASFSCTVIDKLIGSNSTFKNDTDENTRLSQTFKTLNPDCEIYNVQSFADSKCLQEKSDCQRFSNVALQTSFQFQQDGSKRDSISTHGLYANFLNSNCMF